MGKTLSLCQIWNYGFHEHSAEMWRVTSYADVNKVIYNVEQYRPTLLHFSSSEILMRVEPMQVTAIVYRLMFWYERVCNQWHVCHY